MSENAAEGSVEQTLNTHWSSSGPMIIKGSCLFG